jgi:hypothetical protein
MHQIQIRLPSDNCDGTVQQMRDWLRAHRCEPVDFYCHDLDQGSHTAVVVVEFKTESERCAFADQFASADGD